MPNLRENQLLMLSTIIYLQGVADANGKTLGRIVDNLLNKGGLEKSRNINRIGKTNEYPCQMTKDEWIKLLTYIKEDPELSSLTVKEGIIGERGICAAAFVSKANDVTVAIRGSNHDYQWRDNGQGAYLSETEQQTQYLEYLKGLSSKNVTVTGHSKGGNIAAYLAVLSDKVDRCVSFDGQGFSKEFVEKHREKIRLNCHKITAIEPAADIVGPLLISIAGEKKYIKTEKQKNLLHNHRPHIMLDDSGNLRGTTEQSLQSKLINKFTVHFISTAEEPQRSYAIDGVMGFFMKDPGLVGNTQKMKAVGILASKVPSFILSQIKGTHASTHYYEGLKELKGINKEFGITEENRRSLEVRSQEVLEYRKAKEAAAREKTGERTDTTRQPQTRDTFEPTRE
jgi:dienelactone hydrolase